MRFALLFVLAGCASGGFSIGPDATAEIKDVMRTGVGGDAAMLAGDDAFLLQADALAAERQALLDALIAKSVYDGYWARFEGEIRTRHLDALRDSQHSLDPASHAPAGGFPRNYFKFRD